MDAIPSLSEDTNYRVVFFGGFFFLSLFPLRILFICSLYFKLEVLLNFLVYHAHLRERFQKYDWSFSRGRRRKDELLNGRLHFTAIRSEDNFLDNGA